MNRIKFRAWYKGKLYPVAAMILDPLMIFVRATLENGGTAQFQAEGGNYVLMQSTGLLDKVGQEIFEGDILDVAGTPWHRNKGNVLPMLVRYGTGTFDDGCYKYTGFYLEYEKDGRQGEDWLSLHQGAAKEYKVIGNQFENPDLWRHRHTCRRIHQYDPDYKPFDMKEAQKGLKQYAEQVRKDFMQESIDIFERLHNCCKSKGPIR